jgi:hypothetical protein
MAETIEAGARPAPVFTPANAGFISKKARSKQILSVRATPERIERNLLGMVDEWRRQYRADYLNIPQLMRRYDIGEATARSLAYAMMECGK